VGEHIMPLRSVSTITVGHYPLISLISRINEAGQSPLRRLASFADRVFSVTTLNISRPLHNIAWRLMLSLT